ncbi:MAG: tRNA pseudouridine(55) synthase TruB [Candidatus Zixiibacteriota bacterium]|nr:MAG: tRNA pseudouridine(55) synthase TruB [candidate division Zixibacteria bacterium]
MNLSGVLVVDKPTGVTSHDVVQELRRVLGTRRIGHTGTLDPAASGVLLACVGKGTKVAQFLTGYDKEYRAVVKLGATSDTYDGEGKIEETEEECQVSPERIRDTIDSFKGEIWQLPPLHSAIKYKGKRLYQYAREKEEVVRTKRKVEIREISVMDVNVPYVELKVSCSKGTYVRSLAHDVGQKLGCGAYLFSLRRTRVGPFGLQDALSPGRISELKKEGKMSEALISIEQALAHLPSVAVREDSVAKVRNGARLVSSSVSSVDGSFEAGRTVSVKDERGRIIAMGKALSRSEKFLDSSCKGELVEYLRVL